jgi:hypothetical protein
MATGVPAVSDVIVAATSKLLATDELPTLTMKLNAPLTEETVISLTEMVCAPACRKVTALAKV